MLPLHNAPLLKGYVFSCKTCMAVGIIFKPRLPVYQIALTGTMRPIRNSIAVLLSTSI